MLLIKEKLIIKYSKILALLKNESVIYKYKKMLYLPEEKLVILECFFITVKKLFRDRMKLFTEVCTLIYVSLF